MRWISSSKIWHIITRRNRLKIHKCMNTIYNQVLLPLPFLILILLLFFCHQIFSARFSVINTNKLLLTLLFDISVIKGSLRYSLSSTQTNCFLFCYLYFSSVIRGSLKVRDYLSSTQTNCFLHCYLYFSSVIRGSLQDSLSSTQKKCSLFCFLYFSSVIRGSLKVRDSLSST